MHHWRIEPAVTFLRSVVDFDLAEIQRDLVRGNNVLATPAPGLEIRNQNVRKFDFQILLLFLARPAACEKSFFDMLPGCAGEKQLWTRLVYLHAEVEVVHGHFSGTTTGAAAAMRSVVHLPPTPGLQIDFVLMF